MKVKIYNLTIAYNEDTDEVEYIQESIDDEVDTYIIGEIELNSYFDEETLELLSSNYILGES